jgi:hypothetical protein
VKGAGSAKFDLQRIDIFYADSVSKYLTVQKLLHESYFQ